MSGIFHGYHKTALHKSFIPGYRKYCGQHNRTDICVAHYGKDFLCSVWLYFVLDGVKCFRPYKCTVYCILGYCDILGWGGGLL